MAEIRGLVMKTMGERAQVKVNFNESELKNLPKYLDCWNPISAKTGDDISAEMREFDNKTGKLILYGLPVAGVLAGLAFGHSMAVFFDVKDIEWIILTISVILWLIVTVSYARIFKRDAMREGSQPTIYEIHVQEMVVEWTKK